MVNLGVTIVILIGLLAVKNVDAIDACGMEAIPKCQLQDDDCIMNKMEPKLREWMLQGQPGYFVDALEPLVLEEISVLTDDGAHKLKNVNITGFSDARLVKRTLNLQKSLIEFEYVYKFNMTAQDLINSDGESILKEAPLQMYFDKLVVRAKSTIKLISRCDGESYFKCSDYEAAVKKDNIREVVGGNTVRPEVVQKIATAVGLAATDTLAGNIRTLLQILPMKTMMVGTVGPSNKLKEELIRLG